MADVAATTRRVDLTALRERAQAKQHGAIDGRASLVVPVDVVLALVAAVEAAQTYIANRKHPLDGESCAIWVELDDVTGMCHPVGTCDCGWNALRAALVPFVAGATEGGGG